MAESKPSGWRRLLLAIPILGLIYFKWLSPDTYYRADTTSMFLPSVHSSVLEVLDRMMEAKGIRALSEDAREPIHRDFFRK